MTRTILKIFKAYPFGFYGKKLGYIPIPNNPMDNITYRTCAIIGRRHYSKIMFWDSKLPHKNDI